MFDFRINIRCVVVRPRSLVLAEWVDFVKKNYGGNYTGVSKQSLVRGRWEEAASTGSRALARMARSASLSEGAFAPRRRFARHR